MNELLETKKYNQSKYAKFHNDIFSLLGKGYSVQKICDILNNENPEMNLKLHGIYSYIRLRKKDGDDHIIENIPTEKKSGVQIQTQPEESTVPKGQPLISRGNAASAFVDAGLVSNPVTRQKQDDVFNDDD